MCEELRKRRVDVCCMEDVRWKGACFVGTSGRRYKLWWSGNNAGIGGLWKGQGARFVGTSGRR